MNKKLYYLFLIILFLNIKLYGQNNVEKAPIRTEWQKIKYKERNVEFLLPENNYKISNDTIISKDLGNIELISFTLTRTNSKSELLSYGYTFNHYKYPNYKFKKDEIDAFLQGAVENILEMTNGKLFFNKKISYKGHPGREIYFSVPNSVFYFNMKMYLINNEQYSMTVLTENDNLLNTSINKFLNSLKIIKL
jgi:hypothetical protein